jgi:Leucine-rich repeat (LRR) protein
MDLSISIHRDYSDLNSSDTHTMEELVHAMVCMGAMAGLAGVTPLCKISLSLSDADMASLERVAAIAPLCTRLGLLLEGGKENSAAPAPPAAALACLAGVCTDLSLTCTPPRRVDALMAAVAQALSVTSLRLRHCALHDLVGLEGLTTLKLCHASLTTVPDFVARLPHLATLSLKHNHIAELPDFMACLPVRTLSLSHNALTGLRHLPNCVVRLKLRSALGRMTAAERSAAMEALLFKCAHVEELDISDNAWGALPLAGDVHILAPHLRSVRMDNNGFAVLPAFATGLLKIRASFNRFRVVHPLPGTVRKAVLGSCFDDPDALATVVGEHTPHLRELWLNRNALTAPLEVCARVPQLQILNLCGVKLHGPFPRMPCLKALCLDVAPPDLGAACPSLRVLDIHSAQTALPASLCLCRELQSVLVMGRPPTHCSVLCVQRNCSCVQDHMHIWSELAGRAVAAPPGLERLVCDWSSRIMACPDFVPNWRAFAGAVADILDAASQPAFAALFEAQVGANMASCTDRTAAALNELYVGARLHTLPHSPEDAAALLARAACTAALQQYVAAWCAAHVTHKESAQVYLWAVSAAAARLPLLTVTTDVANYEYTTQLGLPDVDDMCAAVAAAAGGKWVELCELHGLVRLEDALAHFHDELDALDEAHAGLDQYTDLAARRAAAALEHCRGVFGKAAALLGEARV